MSNDDKPAEVQPGVYAFDVTAEEMSGPSAILPPLRYDRPGCWVVGVGWNDDDPARMYGPFDSENAAEAWVALNAANLDLTDWRTFQVTPPDSST